MIGWMILALRLLFAGLKSRRNLLLEILALHHQLQVLMRASRRPRLTPLDRALWAWLSKAWRGWKSRLYIVQPSTVLQWHRAGFRLFWRWKSSPRTPGRKAITPDTIRLIREMSRANPLWGAPRIHGELLKLGLDVAQRTVAKYMISRRRRPPSQNWKTFLRNHLGSMVSVDFLTVPTLTFQVLYVFVVLSHHQAHLRRLLHSYLEYYHQSRCHLSLEKDAPESRPVQAPGDGKVVAIPQVGGLHHRYEHRAA